jgi:hypothetical protein
MTDTDYTNGLGVFSEALVPFTGELGALIQKRTPINVCSLARLFPENFCSFLNQKCDALLPKVISSRLAALRVKRLVESSERSSNLRKASVNCCSTCPTGALAGKGISV